MVDDGAQGGVVSVGGLAQAVEGLGVALKGNRAARGGGEPAGGAGEREIEFGQVNLGSGHNC